MNILLPFYKKEYYPYLEELINYSDNNFLFRKMEACEKGDSEIINIHWPEALYNWKQPTSSQLDQLELWFRKIRGSKKIIYTKHDRERTKGTTPNFDRLFEIVEKNTDAFIHLGEYSKALYEKKYSSAIHKIIPHPLLQSDFNKIEKADARKRLGIDHEAIVIIAPGNIRHSRERKIVLGSFKKLKFKNKVLISTNMRNEMKFDFPGRVRLQKIFDIQQFVKNKFKAAHQPPEYIFDYSPVSQDEIILRISAADVVLIPRVDILNSGIVFLAASFQKVAVGPRCGNITEVLKEQNLPIFDPYSISSVTNALSKGIEIFKNDDFQWRNLSKYNPQSVAQKYDQVYAEIIKNDT